MYELQPQQIDRHPSDILNVAHDSVSRQQNTEAVTYKGLRKGTSRTKQPPSIDDEEAEDEELLEPDTLVDLNLRLACPYFKRNPAHVQVRQSCRQGFSNVRRLKEHLYRMHVRSPFCPRCHGVFSNHLELRQHVHSSVCSVKLDAPSSDYGLGRKQILMLKSRKGNHGKSQYDMWYKVYRIVFPNDDHEDILSPYHEGESLILYERFLAREAPSVLRNVLESRIPQLMLKSEVIGRSIRKLINDFRAELPFLKGRTRDPNFRSAAGGINDTVGQPELNDIRAHTEISAAVVSIRDWLNAVAQVEGGDVVADTFKQEIFMSLKNADTMSDSAHGSTTKSNLDVDDVVVHNDYGLISSSDGDEEAGKQSLPAYFPREGAMSNKDMHFQETPARRSETNSQEMNLSIRKVQYDTIEKSPSEKDPQSARSTVTKPRLPDTYRDSETGGSETSTMGLSFLAEYKANSKLTPTHETSTLAKIGSINDSLSGGTEIVSDSSTIDIKEDDLAKVEVASEADVSLEIFSATTAINDSIAAFKKKVIRAVIHWSQNHIREVTGFKGCAGEAAPSMLSSGRSAEEDPENESNSNRPRKDEGHKRKREGWDDGVGEGGLNPNPGKKGKLRRRTATRWLACPYYQRYPEQCEARSCSGSGYATVTILKKCHLSRHHKRPPQCPRCWQYFEDEVAKELHWAEDCEKSSEPEDDRISNLVWAQISSQKKFNEATSEEEKWCLMFKLIFPDDDNIPSPYYINSAKSTQDVEALCRTTLPQLFLERLENDLDVCLNPIYHSLITKVPAMIDDCLKEIFQMHRQPRIASDTDSTYRSATSRSASSPISSLSDMIAGPVAQSMTEDLFNLFESTTGPFSNKGAAEQDYDENPDWSMSEMG